MPCLNCLCFFDIKSNTNIFNCSKLPMKTHLMVPNFTKTCILSGSKISELPAHFFERGMLPSTISQLDLSKNQIRRIPEVIQSVKSLAKIYLSGNPFVCDCKMTWMITWLNNCSDIVKDYKQITCGSGRFKDIPIHVLTEVALGCYPHNWTTAQKVGVAAGVALVVAVFSIISVVLRKRREVKFLLYHYLNLNTFPKDDPKEKLDDIHYDAFLCYW